MTSSASEVIEEVAKPGKATAVTEGNGATGIDGDLIVDNEAGDIGTHLQDVCSTVKSHTILKLVRLVTAALWEGCAYAQSWNVWNSGDRQSRQREQGIAWINGGKCKGEMTPRRAEFIDRAHIKGVSPSQAEVFSGAALLGVKTVQSACIDEEIRG